MGYIISRWALVRRGELAVAPKTIEVHSDFLRTLSRKEFERAFRQIGDMFYRIMTDISETPECFAMPLHDEKTTRYGAAEAQESRHAAWRPMKLLYTLFTHGNLSDCGFSVDIPAFKQANKIKNIHVLFNALKDYGFVFSGLANDKITPKTTEFTIKFPDNPNDIVVMAEVARKAANVDAENMFHRWSFRLLAEGLRKNSYNDCFYAVYDKTRTKEECAFIHNFHQAMRKIGYFHAHGGWNEGPGICYYDNESVIKRKGPYLFRIIDWMGDLRLMLRIRNAEKCIDVYKNNGTPKEIADMFRYSDRGCGARTNGTCKKSIRYNFEGEQRWHCSCCSAPFWLRPKTENISHYIKLVEIGEKR
ncbi:MAG: hypothetical protein FWE88_05580 [Phycisphaerae bacterium]|nr:hypothetical protein [Phycisphaerae bacterium]